jgi:hypothetical protein
VRGKNAIEFRRTPQEVLHIVYLTEKKGVSKGGVLPEWNEWLSEDDLREKTRD